MKFHGEHHGKIALPGFRSRGKISAQALRRGREQNFSAQISQGLGQGDPWGGPKFDLG